MPSAAPGPLPASHVFDLPDALNAIATMLRSSRHVLFCIYPSSFSITLERSLNAPDSFEDVASVERSAISGPYSALLLSFSIFIGDDSFRDVCFALFSFLHTKI